MSGSQPVARRPVQLPERNPPWFWISSDLRSLVITLRCFWNSYSDNRILRTRRPSVILPAIFCRLAFFTILTVVPNGMTADKPAEALLENFLKGLAYESIPLKRNEDNNHLSATGKLEGKTRDFLIDTG